MGPVINELTVAGEFVGTAGERRGDGRLLRVKGRKLLPLCVHSDTGGGNTPTVNEGGTIFSRGFSRGSLEKPMYHVRDTSRAVQSLFNRPNGDTSSGR